MNTPIGDLVIVNDVVPNPFYRGRVGVIVEAGDVERPWSRTWMVRFPLGYGTWSLPEMFRRCEIDAPAEHVADGDHGDEDRL